MDYRRKKTNGFTLIELLAVIAIIFILMAIAVPSLARARGQAKNVLCRNNLRNIYLCQIAYSNDYDYWLPSVSRTHRLGGHWGFRAAKGYKSKYDRRGLEETFGLNALMSELGYISYDNPVWICPDLSMKWMLEYGCTYAFSTAGILGMHRLPVLARYPRSQLVFDNIVYYTPSPVGWYVESTSRPMSTIPVDERRSPHSYLSKKKTGVDTDTYMTVTIDGWTGTNADNRERVR